MDNPIYRFFAKIKISKAVRISITKSTVHSSLQLRRLVARVGSALLVAMAFYVLFSNSTLLGTANSASLRNGQTMHTFLKASQTQSPGKAPSISLNGANPYTQECDETFEDPGATATNSSGQFLPVTVSGTVDTAAPGTYTLTYTAVDNENSISVERAVTVVDTTPPQIALQRGKTISIGCGESFTDPGASAIDNCQGTVPVTISGSVYSNIPGTYTISYTAKDKYDNTRTVERRVIVGSVEDNPPTFTLNGDAEMTIECGSNFTDPGATAVNPCSSSAPVTTSGTVDIRVPETYCIIYTASAGELTAETSRIVHVMDTTAPVISLQGNSPMKVELGKTFTDPGATAHDGCAGDFAATAIGAVDSTKLGSYTITYTASDPAGNQAIPVTRTVNVVDGAQNTIIPGLSLANYFPIICKLSGIEDAGVVHGVRR